MPRIYLSPSTQEHNLYVNGGTEEEYMNKVADALTPWLDSSGILYTRNTPDMTAAASIRQSNQGHYDLHVAIHSNAAPEDRYGEVRGSLPFYYPGSAEGKRLADLMTANAKKIYPLPQLAAAVPSAGIGELRQTRAPAVLWETAYHDNEEDATWIKENIDNLAWAVAASVAQYLGVPLVPPTPAREAAVSTQRGRLNIRSLPNTRAPIVARAASGSPITVLGEVDSTWSTVRYGSVTGYAASRYLE